MALRWRRNGHAALRQLSRDDPELRPAGASMAADISPGTPARIGSTSSGDLAALGPRPATAAASDGMTPLNIAFFGSSLVSAYWNGAATYYRGILQASHSPDIASRSTSPMPSTGRNIATFPIQAGRRSWFIRADAGRRRSTRWTRPANADLLVKASGVGVFDEAARSARAGDRRPGAIASSGMSMRRRRSTASPAIPRPVPPADPAYDIVFTYGGGQPVVAAYARFGARQCVPIYNALDPTTHRPVPPDPRFRLRSRPLANRLPDRERRIDDFFLAVAADLPDRRFLLGGNGWGDKALPPIWLSRPYLYARPQRVQLLGAGGLNVSRDSMAVWFCPPTRVFEAAGPPPASSLTMGWNRPVLRAGARDPGRRKRPRRGRTSRPAPEARAPHRARRRSAGVGGTHLCAAGRATAARAGRDRPVNAVIAPAPEKLRIVILGLSITSSWGNGHATTYRGAGAGALPPRPRGAVPRARHAVVSRAPRPAAAAIRQNHPLRWVGGIERAVGTAPCARRIWLSSALTYPTESQLRNGYSASRGSYRILRHRYAGDVDSARRQGVHVSCRRADPGLRSLFVVHRRSDLAAY